MNTEWTDPHVSTRTHKRQTEKVYQATHTQKSERARVSVGHTSSLTLTHTQRLEEGERGTTAGERGEAGRTEWKHCCSSYITTDGTVEGPLEQHIAGQPINMKIKARSQFCWWRKKWLRSAKRSSLVQFFFLMAASQQRRICFVARKRRWVDAAAFAVFAFLRFHG